MNLPLLKVGIVGLGRMGGYHVTVIRKLRQAKLVAVADLDKSKWRKASGRVVTTVDFHDWLDIVDAVVVATPTPTHYQIARDCLLAGKSVLVEKPLTNKLSDAAELFELALSSGLTVHVGHVERFNGAIQGLSKVLTKPLFIETSRIGPFDPRVKSESVILDLMIHDLDLILSIAGSKVSKINPAAISVRSDSAGIASVQLIFETGLIANLVASRSSQIKKRTMQIHQHDSLIKIDFINQDISVYRNGADHVLVSNGDVSYSKKESVEHLYVYKVNPLLEEVSFFVDSVIDGTNEVDYESELRVLKLTFEIEKVLGIRGLHRSIGVRRHT